MKAGVAEPADFLSLLRSGVAAPEVRQFAARGVLPLDSQDQIRALLAVLEDEEPEIAATARKTFDDTPPEEIIAFLDRGSPGEMEIHRIARTSSDALVLERLVRLRGVADQTLEMLARTATGPAQEAIVVNQVRLLRQPALIEALFANPGLTADSRRRLNEVREEFFDKEKRRQEAERALRELEEAGGLLGGLEEDDGEAEAAAGEAAAEEEDPETSIALAAIYKRISVMTVSEKVNLAYSGGKDERRILVGDSNKLVGLAVLKSRGLTMNEIELFCTMRYLDPEIFRKIALNREWMRHPAIISAMVKNPKVPVAISLPLVKFLPQRQLKSIMRDPNLPEGLRITARKRMEEKRR